MSSLLADAVAALKPKDVKACLETDPSAAAPALHVVNALRAWTRLRSPSLGTALTADGSPPPELVAAVALQKRFVRVVQLLLEAGANPRGMVPRDTCSALDQHGDSDLGGCSLPVEAAICLIQPAEFALPLIALLRKHGSPLEGLCDGRCGTARSCGQRCGALSCALRTGMSIPDDASLAMLAASGLDTSIFINRELVSSLMATGAATVEVASVGGRLTAAQAALVSAALAKCDHVAAALLAGGLSPDFIVNAPMPPPFPPTRSHLLHLVIEEATDEAHGEFADARPDILEPRRETQLRVRAQLRPEAADGPGRRILRSILAAGCPVGLAFRRVSSRTGTPSTALIYPAQLGAIDVVRDLLAAGADPNALADEADPAPSALQCGVETPLEVAAAWGHANVVRALLDAGGDAGRSPRALANAAKEGYTDCLEVLLAAPRGRATLEHVLVQPRTFAGMTPLMVAALHQQPASVAMLIAAGARAAPSAAVAAAAAAAGADPDDPRASKTPMAVAILGGASPDVIDELVAGGAARPVLKGARGSGGSGVDFHGRTGVRVRHADIRGGRYRLDCDGCGAQAEAQPGGRALMLCGRCKLRRYCSVECQRAAWKKGHAEECKALVGAAGTGAQTAAGR